MATDSMRLSEALQMRTAASSPRMVVRESRMFLCEPPQRCEVVLQEDVFWGSSFLWIEMSVISWRLQEWEAEGYWGLVIGCVSVTST